MQSALKASTLAGLVLDFIRKPVRELLFTFLFSPRNHLPSASCNLQLANIAHLNVRLYLFSFDDTCKSACEKMNYVFVARFRAKSAIIVSYKSYFPKQIFPLQFVIISTGCIYILYANLVSYTFSTLSQDDQRQPRLKMICLLNLSIILSVCPGRFHRCRFQFVRHVFCPHSSSTADDETKGTLDLV